MCSPLPLPLTKKNKLKEIIFARKDTTSEIIYQASTISTGSGVQFDIGVESVPHMPKKLKSSTRSVPAVVGMWNAFSVLL